MNKDIINNELIKELVDFLNINYFVIDSAGKYLARNETLTKVVGNTPDAATVDAKAWSSCQEVMRTGKKQIIEEEYKGRWYLSLKTPLLDGNNATAVMGIAIDITDQKKIIAQQEMIEALALAKKKIEEASWAKTEFIQNMSHDLKTPLTTMMGMAELLSYSEQDSMRKERLMMIHHAGKRITDVLTNVLEVVNVEAGEYAVHYQDVDIRDIFQGILELYQPLAQEKNIAFVLDVAEDVPQFISCDIMRLQRILLNLAGNALKFTISGSVKINAELEDAKNMLTLKVEDTGIGMPEDKLEIIFEKFVRLTPAYEGVYAGAGLGLSMVKRFIEELHGTISATSREGEGTVFTCKIPLSINHSLP